MLIIKFHRNVTADKTQEFVDTAIYAVNDLGQIAMKPVARQLPDPASFTPNITLLGIAKIGDLFVRRPTDRQLLYTFEDINAELIDGHIQGLSANSSYQPIYTIIVVELGKKICLAKGIEKIYYSNF